MTAKIDGDDYVIDVQKIFEIISVSNNENSFGREIIDGYDVTDEDDVKLSLVSKTVRETTTNGDTSINNIRYDFIKSLIDYVLSNIDIPYLDSDSNLNFGIRLCINTLIEQNILIKKQ